MTSRVLSLVAVLAALVFLAGCDSRAEDRGALVDVMEAIDDCNNRADGKAILELVTRESVERYGELVRLGLDGTREEVLTRGPNDQLEILRMRARAKRSELEKLSPRQYVAFATSRGWYRQPESDRGTTSLREIRFGPSGATAEPVLDGEPVGERIRFVEEDGRWKLDEASAMAAYDVLLRAEAKARGLSVQKFLVEILEDELGKPAPKNIWDPMPRGGLP